MANVDSSATGANTTVCGVSKPRLTWLGDDIGLSNGEDATVQLLDSQMPGGRWHVDLSSLLPVAELIDVDGLRRINESLRLAMRHGSLSSCDAAVWQSHAERLSILLEQGHE